MKIPTGHQSFLVLLLIFTNSCKNDTIEKDALRTVYFDNEVYPIFLTNCAISGCHTNGNEYDFRSYEGILKGVKKGDAQNSKIYQAITSVWDEPMPPDRPLSENQRSLIRIWIEQGALNNKAPNIIDPVDTGNNQNFKVCFSRDILPVLLANCATTGCHDNTTRQEGIAITNYNNIMQLVRAGDPNSSELFEVITEDDPEDRMPPSGALPQAAIDSIRNWILAGALNEICPSKCDTNVFTFSGAVKPTIDMRCKSCHNATNTSGNVNLENYSGIALAANSGKLVGVLKGINGYPQMPPSGPIEPCAVTSIEKWVNAGAKNN